jgi:hypothetical protein
MNLISEEELHRRELANSVSAALFLGAFVALAMMPFVDRGAVLLSLIGG